MTSTELRRLLDQYHAAPTPEDRKECVRQTQALIELAIAEELIQPEPDAKQLTLLEHTWKLGVEELSA